MCHRGLAMHWRTRLGNRIFVTAIAIASGVVAVEPRPATALDLLGLFGGDETPRAAVAAPDVKTHATSKQKILRDSVSRDADTRERPIRLARKIDKRGGDRPEPQDIDDDSLLGLDTKPWKRVESKNDSRPPVTARRHLPLFVVVALGEQQLTVYNHDGVVTRSQISSGMPGHETPRGIFTILARELMHHSNLYSNAPMPFMQRVTWSGVAMHTGVVPGHPASHGCVRLPASFAPKLWGLTKIGERVIISHENVQPEPISHSWLPVPKMTPAPAALPEKGREKDRGDIATPAVAPPVTQPAATNAPAPSETPRRSDDSTRQTTTGGAGAPANGVATPRTLSLTTPSFVSSAEAAPLAPSTPDGAPAAAPIAESAAPQKLLNPREYAEELKKKVVADLAAARRQARDLSAALAVKRSEFARVGAAQRAAENALAAAHARLDQATKRLEKAIADVEAKKQEAANPPDPSSPAAARAARSAQQIEAALNEKFAAVEAKLEAEYALPELNAKLDAARKSPAALDAEISDLARRLVDAESTAEEATKAEKMARRSTEAVSVLISRKDKKIYVRQGLVPVFEASATIRDPDSPLGTHLFIATAPGDDGKSLQWTVLSPPTDGQRITPGPSAALDRIELAQDVRDRLSELFWTGGSIIVSDQPPSSETGADGTDLTVRAR